MTKVLVFESDAEFARTLSTGLAAYGCNVTVVADGEDGIEVASHDKPDLILLTIELPRMNGFSVCNKLRRNNDLKSVPLALLSNEATEETFEQHKRLRTRADAYVHKPITVDELVAKISDLVVLTKQSSAADGFEDDDVLIDDEFTDEEAEASAALEQEADVAFGNLMIGGSSPRAASVAPPRPAPAPSHDEIEMDDLELEEEVGLAAASAAAQQKIESLSLSLEAQARQIEELEANLLTAKAAADAEADAKMQVAKKKDAEIELVQQELESLRQKFEANESVGTAREFLDLRERLNKKDKEILDIRDELTSKEKALIKANDEAITVGREKADLVDQVQAFISKTSELEKLSHSLAQDKDQAQKRGDDFKTKSERLQSELDAKAAELKQAIETHENAIAIKEAQMASLREDHQAALSRAAIAAEEAQNQAVLLAIEQAEEKAAGEKEAALVQAAEESKRERQEALAARSVELKAEHDAKMASLHRANEESMRKLRAEHAHEKEQEKNAAAEHLAGRERQLNSEKEAALAELGAQKAASEQERDNTIARLQADLNDRTRERDQDRDTIQQREGTIAQLEATIASLRAELVETADRLQTETGLLTQARGKWSEDASSIRAAREALGQALAQLEQALERPIP